MKDLSYFNNPVKLKGLFVFSIESEIPMNSARNDFLIEINID